MYRLRWPLSHMFQKLGVPISIQLEVVFDAEAKVYVATSKDVAGLILEANSLDEIKIEASELIPQFIQFKQKATDILFHDHAAHA